MTPLDSLIIMVAVGVLLWIVRFSMLAFWPEHEITRFLERKTD